MAKPTMAHDIVHTMFIQDTPRRTHVTKRREVATANDVPLTLAVRAELKRELSALREEKERDIPSRLRIARQFGGGANNDEHLAIREEEAVLTARIARLQDILRRSTVIDDQESDHSVAIGSRVSVVDVETGENLDYLIEGAHAAPTVGSVSVLSPVGRVLAGRRRGEEVSVRLPSGRRRKLRLREIRSRRSS
jgi:transcription elongation factor GreA